MAMIPPFSAPDIALAEGQYKRSGKHELRTGPSGKRRWHRRFTAPEFAPLRAGVEESKWGEISREWEEFGYIGAAFTSAIKAYEEAMGPVAEAVRELLKDETFFGIKNRALGEKYPYNGYDKRLPIHLRGQEPLLRYAASSGLAERPVWDAFRVAILLLPIQGADAAHGALGIDEYEALGNDRDMLAEIRKVVNGAGLHSAIQKGMSKFRQAISKLEDGAERLRKSSMQYVAQREVANQMAAGTSDEVKSATRYRESLGAARYWKTVSAARYLQAMEALEDYSPFSLESGGYNGTYIAEHYFSDRLRNQVMAHASNGALPSGLGRSLALGVGLILLGKTDRWEDEGPSSEGSWEISITQDDLRHVFWQEEMENGLFIGSGITEAGEWGVLAHESAYRAWETWKKRGAEYEDLRDRDPGFPGEDGTGEEALHRTVDAFEKEVESLGRSAPDFKESLERKIANVLAEDLQFFGELNIWDMAWTLARSFYGKGEDAVEELGDLVLQAQEGRTRKHLTLIPLSQLKSLQDVLGLEEFELAPDTILTAYDFKITPRFDPERLLMAMDLIPALRIMEMRDKPAPNDYGSPYWFVRGMIDSWASTAADSPYALAIQKAIAEEFEIEDRHRDQLLENPQMASHVEGMEKGEDLLIPLMRKAVRTMYDQTQKWLKERGLKEVALFRGIKLPEPPAWDEGAAGEAEPPWNPASSFSYKVSEARSFARPRHDRPHGYMFSAIIPAERVLGSFVTGFGCMSEGEVVVLATPGKVRYYAVGD